MVVLLDSQFYRPHSFSAVDFVFAMHVCVLVSLPHLRGIHLGT